MLTLSKIRGIGSTSTGTGKRADSGEKRRDHRSSAAAAGTGGVGAADSFGSL